MILCRMSLVNNETFICAFDKTSLVSLDRYQISLNQHCYTLRSTMLKGGILVSPCSSVCPSVDKIVSALYLLQYSPDPFNIYTSYQATSEGVKVFFKIQKFEVLANSLNL